MSTHAVEPRRSGAHTDMEALRERLKDAEDTLRAIRLGEADAIVVNGPEGPRVYTLVTADQSYRTLVEQMRDAALIVSEEGTILYCNPRLEQLLRRRDSVSGAVLFDLAAAEDRPALRELLAAGGKGEASGEVRLERAPGESVSVHLSVSALSTGSFRGLAIIATDLTERQRRERAAEEDRLTEAVLELAGTAILVCDAEGRVLRANQQAAALFGALVPYTSVSELLSLRMPVAALAAAGRPEEYEVQQGDRAPASVLVRARSLSGVLGSEQAGWVLTITDITDLKRAELAADRASRAKSEFLAVMSHELRTPLNSVIGYADLLLMETHGDLTEVQRRHAERIKASAHHQLALIEEILAYTRVEAGQEHARIAPADAARVLRDAVEYVRPAATAKRLNLELALAQPELEMITDAGRLRQIVLNLVGNAVKFTRNGIITVSAGFEADVLVIRVRDTGPGIPEDMRHTIFEPFTQVEQGNTREVGGSGLGLAIVSRLTALLGGSIELESEMGRGSTFIVRIPNASY